MRGIVQAYSELHPIGLGTRHSKLVPFAPIALSPPIDTLFIIRKQKRRYTLVSANQICIISLSCCSYIAQAPHERSPASFDPVNTGHSLSSRYPSMQSRLSGSAGRKRGTHGRVCVKNMSLTPVPVVVHIWIMAVRLRRLMIKIQASNSYRAAAELGTAVSTQNMNKPSN